MAATLLSSLFNIVMDYVLMFPLHMGMRGASLATAISPIIGIIICMMHFLSGKSTVRMWNRGSDGEPDSRVSSGKNTVRLQRGNFFSVKRLLRSWQLGISAFIGEFAQGVITLSFNFLILGLTGNVGVAAYGVIANIAFVANSIFNGLSQGSQPLFSMYHGKQENDTLKKLLRISIITGLVLAVAVLLLANVFADPLISIFNSEGNQGLLELARPGMHIYFFGYLFASVNIVICGYLAAVEAAAGSFVTSILRGLAAILFFAFLLSSLIGMTGIWLAFPAAELATMVVAIVILTLRKRVKVK